MSTILEKLNTDRILSVTAILIGMMTLVVYFIQTRLIIDQQHAGVWPCIEITGTNFGDGTGIKEDFKVNITNKGIGPAIIKKVEIKYRGKIYKEFPVVFELATKSNNYMNSSLEGRTMASNETVNPIQIYLSKEGHKFAQLFYNHDSIQTKIYYQSVYGKCFVSTGVDAKELPDCSALEEKK
jgi:hypothetical protein